MNCVCLLSGYAGYIDPNMLIILETNSEPVLFYRVCIYKRQGKEKLQRLYAVALREFRTFWIVANGNFVAHLEVMLYRLEEEEGIQPCLWVVFPLWILRDLFAICNVRLVMKLLVLALFCKWFIEYEYVLPNKDTMKSFGW